MIDYNPNKMRATFLRDIKNHALHIVKDDGVYRHLIFQKPDTYNMQFILNTFPNHLVYTGDMGTYVFSRIEDMFKFFRKKELEFDSHYWAEKCIAESVFGNGIREFSIEDFHANVRDYVHSWLELEADAEITADVIDDLGLSDVLCADNEIECVYTLWNYSGKIEFCDFWEHSNMRKTYHFIWCLYAIAWGIQQYDKREEHT